MITTLFWLFSGVSIAAALLCITRRSPVASALWLVVTLFGLAADFVLLDAQFIAVLQVLVYAGAIMVLFLFVIMLLNAGRPGQPTDIRGWLGRIIALGLGLVLVTELLVVRGLGPPEQVRLAAGGASALARERGVVGMLVDPLFRTYLIPFEITSLLLLAAVIGAVVLAKRKL